MTATGPAPTATEVGPDPLPVPADGPLDGVATLSPPELVDRRPWLRWVPGVALAPVLLGLAVPVLADPLARSVAGPFLVGAFVLIELLAIYFPKAAGAGSGDLVVTERGIVRRLSWRAFYIPWGLVAAVRPKKWVFDAAVTFRFMARNSFAGGRFPVTSEQERILRDRWPSPSGRPTAATVSVPPPLPHAVVASTERPVRIYWPREAKWAGRVLQIAREPGTSQRIRLLQSTLVLVGGVLAFAIGYIFGSLLIVLAFWAPLVVGLWAGPVLVRRTRSRRRSIALFYGTAAGGTSAMFAPFVLGGFAAFAFPWSLVAIPEMSFATGFLGSTLTGLALWRPEMLA